MLLAEVALLSQSRGSLYATPVMLVLVFALLPGRLRTFALLVPVGAGIAAAAPAVLAVGDHLQRRAVVAATRPHAVAATFAAALARRGGRRLGRGARVADDRSRRRRGGASARPSGAVACGALVAVLAGGLVAAGNPVTAGRTRAGTPSRAATEPTAPSGTGS